MPEPTAMAANPEIATVTPDGKIRAAFHPGQMRAWNSRKRVILILAGTSGGKTSYGPYWLWREIQLRGPGDYLAVSPSFQLMSKKMLPEFLRLFQTRLGLGDYRGLDKTFRFSPEGIRKLCPGSPDDSEATVFFGHADDPESLESATAKAAWLDEAGQKRFKLGSWEAVNRRVAFHQGRILLTTTPYGLGWLKLKVYDPYDEARKHGRDHPEIDVVQFDSTENPAYPASEFERAQRELPRWRFDMMHRGMFTRPAGMIYDCFDPARHTEAPFALPDDWPRFWGMDFGAVNCACVKLAFDPKAKVYHVYADYWPRAKRTEAEHAATLLAGDRRPQRCVGGSRSEGAWRKLFGSAGLSVEAPPVADVEAGVQKIWSLIANGKIMVFNVLEDLIDEIQAYSRAVDEAGNPTAEIEAKETYHRLDALRAIGSHLTAADLRFRPAEKIERKLATFQDLAKKHGLFGLRPGGP